MYKLALLSLFSAVVADKVIVLHDNLNDPALYSTYFEELKSRGNELEFLKITSASDVQLYKYGEPLYDSMIWYAPSVKFGKSTSSLDNILEFIDNGHNVVVAVDNTASDSLREFAVECGVKLDPKKSFVVDYFSNQKKEASNVLTENITKNKVIYKSKQEKILYNGIGHQIVDDEVLAVDILAGESTSYVESEDKKFTSRFGSDVKLVSALQFRNNARVVISGSIKLCSNEFFDASPANKQFCNEVTKWAFGERGVLRVSNVQHTRQDGSAPEIQLKHKMKADLPKSSFPYPEIAPNSLVYRIKDEVSFKFDLEEFVNGKWVPFKADDVQLEFVMLDPYIRKAVPHNDKGNYQLDFTIPDVYGVYKFRVFYRREGFTTVDIERQVSVRPFRHNEYERFIASAYPYYTNAFTMMAGFFVFCIFFLSTKE